MKEFKINIVFHEECNGWFNNRVVASLTLQAESQEIAQKIGDVLVATMDAPGDDYFTAEVGEE